MKAFLLRLNEPKHHSMAQERECVGIGWAAADTLGEFEHDWHGLKNALRLAYPHLAQNERALGNAAGSCRRFLFDMSVGDYVLVPSGTAVHVARVEKPAVFHSDDIKHDFAWQRKVVWLNLNIPRTHADYPLQKRLKARQTCVDITDLLKEIESFRLREEPSDFLDESYQETVQVLERNIHKLINDVDLERLICALTRASGPQSAHILPKNDVRHGDADIEAIYDLGIGGVDARVTVLYQVKHHQGKTGVPGIHQLLDRMEYMSQHTLGCLVTSAKSLDDDAEKIAKDNGILVVCQKELLDWIVMVGYEKIRKFYN